MTRPEPWVRRITEADLKEAIAINREHTADVTKDTDIVRIVERGHANVIVAGHYTRVDGFLIYRDQGNYIEIIHMAVAGDCLRRGVGSAMLQSVLDAMPTHPFEAWVRETNLAAQLFFKAMGWRCVEICHQAYAGSEDAAYLFTLDGDETFDGFASEFKLRKAK
jgi:ribosomal-protein-alanine N-acetyltransferase